MNSTQQLMNGAEQHLNILHQVVKFFGLGDITEIDEHPKGLVNKTYVISTKIGRFIVQRLNPMFNESAIMDHNNLVGFLQSRSFPCPQLLHTPAGSLCTRQGGALWKISEYIDHDGTIRPTPASISSAAALLGRFHEVTAEYRTPLKASIIDFHKPTRVNMKLLAVFMDWREIKNVEGYREAQDYFFRNISKHDALSGDQLLIHGDPKFDNFLFKEDKAVALIDFDTLMIGSRLVDLGDGMRSWCRVNKTKFDENIFKVALDAYNSEVLEKVFEDEVRNATALLTLELGARFLIDCFEDYYFDWSSPKYESREDHNYTRACEMIAYHQSIIA